MNKSEIQVWSPALNRREFLRWLGGGIGLAAAGILAACAPAVTPTAVPPPPTAVPPTKAPVVAPTAVPQATGKISVYSALNQSTNDAFFAAFKAAVPGIDVELLPLAAAGALQTRIVAEKDSPKGDIFVGGDRAFHDHRSNAISRGCRICIHQQAIHLDDNVMDGSDQ